MMLFTLRLDETEMARGELVPASLFVDTEWSRFVEFESAKDLATAVEKLDSHEFKGATVHCTADVSAGFPHSSHRI